MWAGREQVYARLARRFGAYPATVSNENTFYENGEPSGANRTRLVSWLQRYEARLAVEAMPIDELVKQVGMPGWFIRFISVAEILGGLGLILPSLLKIRPSLTPLAAAGLVIIMIGATVLSLSGSILMALMPFVVGVLAAFVAYGRWRLVPQHSHR